MNGPYSILVLTKDEEVNIRSCLESCNAASDDVHVLDSGREDKTCEIARTFGAEVHVNPFETFGQQRNWAIDNISFRHDWVLHLDADERMTPQFDTALRSAVSRDPTVDGFFLPSKLIFMGRWLRRSDDYPKYQMRFFHRERMRFVDYGHGQRERPGSSIERLEEPYLHLPFEKGLDAWKERHRRYAQQEAQQALLALSEPIPWRDLFSVDPVLRRRLRKAVAYRLPFRAGLRWTMLAILRGGVLEGRAGLRYISLMAWYEHLIATNIAAARSGREGHT